MFTRPIARLGAAALLAVVLVVAAAIPASATVHAVGVQSGSTITIGGHITTIGGHATTHVCATNSAAAAMHTIDLNSTGGGTASGQSLTGYGDFVTGAGVYKFRILMGGSTASITTTTVSLTLTGLRLVFTTCASTSTLCTTSSPGVTATLTGTNPTGSLHPGASTNLSLSGTSTAIATSFTCNTVIRSIINGQTASMSLNLHLTT